MRATKAYRLKMTEEARKIVSQMSLVSASSGIFLVYQSQ